VGPDGKLLAGYRKINLFGNDFLWAKSGDKPAQIAQTELGLMSVVICRDIRDKIPENIPRTASEGPPLFDGQRVELVAACANWGKGGFPANAWMDFVADNKCTLVLANRWGKEENDSHGEYTQDFGQGGSCIIEPDWTVHIDGLKFRQDCVVTAAL
jgi:predicted amidohydrolase